MDLYSSDLTTRLNAIAKAITRLERKTDYILKQLNLQYSDPSEDSNPDPLEEVYDLIREGRKLQAIQVFQNKTGVRTDEATLAVEKLAKRLKYG